MINGENEVSHPPVLVSSLVFSGGNHSYRVFIYSSQMSMYLHRHIYFHLHMPIILMNGSILYTPFYVAFFSLKKIYLMFFSKSTYLRAASLF